MKMLEKLQKSILRNRLRKTVLPGKIGKNNSENSDFFRRRKVVSFSSQSLFAQVCASPPRASSDPHIYHTKTSEREREAPRNKVPLPPQLSRLPTSARSTCKGVYPRIFLAYPHTHTLFTSSVLE